MHRVLPTGALLTGLAGPLGCAPILADGSVERAPSNGAADTASAGTLSTEADPLDADGVAALRTGPWRRVDAAVQGGDPCSFSAYLNPYGYDITAFLPTTFDVQAEVGGFFIEANPYTMVRGPIFCTMDGAAFDCETQQVIPFDDSLYTIDFSGERVDDETLTGTAIVQFRFDEQTEAQLADAGYAMSECDHTFDLTLAWGRF